MQAHHSEQSELDGPYESGRLTEEVDRAVAIVLSRGPNSRAAAWLRSRGLWPSDIDRVLRGGFRCNQIDAVVTARCELKACRYHVPYEWSANCLLAYMQQQNTDALSVDEISFLYRIPVEDVKQSVERSTAALRSQAIDVQATRDDWLKPQFSFVLSRSVCVVCESIVDEQTARSLTIESLGAAYCSRECRDAKPPRIIELEVEKRLPIERILEWTFRHYRTVTLAEQALGMPRWLMYEASQRYLGRPLDSFFRGAKTTSTQRKNGLIRRTWHAPVWVEGLTEQLHPVREELARRFGPAVISLTAYRERLSRVLASV